MPGFFKALSNMPLRKAKKHFINVEGKQYQVTLEKSQWALRTGEQNLTVRNGEIVVKPTPRAMTVYPILKKSEKGYYFEQGDIHWPNKIAQGGVMWQIESE